MSSLDYLMHYMIFEKNEHGAYMGRPICRTLVENEHLNYSTVNLNSKHVCQECKSLKPYKDKIEQSITVHLTSEFLLKLS